MTPLPQGGLAPLQVFITSLAIGLRTFALVAFIGGATLARRCLRGMLAIALGAGIALSVL